MSWGCQDISNGAGCLHLGSGIEQAIPKLPLQSIGHSQKSLEGDEARR